MMTEDQIKVVKQVLRRLTDTEENDWTPIDNTIELLQWLDDEQLVIEAQTILETHKGCIIKCNILHEKTECFAPKFGEASEAIIELYQQTRNLHPSNRYILEYYIALTHLRVIHV